MAIDWRRIIMYKTYFMGIFYQNLDCLSFLSLGREDQGEIRKRGAVLVVPRCEGTLINKCFCFHIADAWVFKKQRRFCKYSDEASRNICHNGFTFTTCYQCWIATTTTRHGWGILLVLPLLLCVINAYNMTKR